MEDAIEEFIEFKENFIRITASTQVEKEMLFTSR